MSNKHKKTKWKQSRKALALGLAAVLVVGGMVRGSDSPTTSSTSSVDDLSKMNIEDLMNVEVTSVSKHKQRTADAPAAISVISQDDIKHSHLQSVPELLRLIPGMEVAQLNSHTYAISARGFNDVFANKLLVLQDGRSVYTPLFSGVFWDMQDPMVDDLERIEVIRGPGATLWGANAVNGVVNIMSKSAADTQGWLLDSRVDSFNLSNQLEQQYALRYGGKIDKSTFYRVWAKTRDTADHLDPIGAVDDGYSALAGGFRIDHTSGDDDTLTVIGNFGNDRKGDISTQPLTTAPYNNFVYTTSSDSAANILGRWTHKTSSKSDISLQMYYDYVNRVVSTNQYEQNTVDIDFQHHFILSDQQEIIWGLGYRFATDNVGYSARASGPNTRKDNIVSAFVQDDLTLVPDQLHVILGTKLEDNSYTGFEFQPSVRLLWTPDRQHTLWASVSRAVRTSSRTEENGRILLTSTPADQNGTAALVTINPNVGLSSEDEIAYELGQRFESNHGWSIDTALFYNHYINLLSYNPGTPTPAVDGSGNTYLDVPLNISNGIKADTYGAEIAASLKVTEQWRLAASYSLLIVNSFNTNPSFHPDDVARFNGLSPKHQAQLHSYYEVSRDLQIDTSAYYVSRLKYSDVPAYVRVDLAATWTIKPDLELSFGVQNLFDSGHTEFKSNSGLIEESESPRTIFAQLVYHF